MNLLKRIFGDKEDDGNLYAITIAANMTGASVRGLLAAVKNDIVPSVRAGETHYRVRLSDVRDALKRGVIAKLNTKRAASSKKSWNRRRQEAAPAPAPVVNAPKPVPKRKTVTATELAEQYDRSRITVNGRMKKAGVSVTMRRGRKLYYNAEQAHAEMQRPLKKSGPENKGRRKVAKPKARAIDTMFDAIARHEKAVQRIDKLATYAQMRDAMLEIGRELENGHRDEIRGAS